MQSSGAIAWLIAAAGAGGALLFQPLVAHYLPAAREAGAPDFWMAEVLHPSLPSWFDVGPRHWFWGWATHPGWSRGPEFVETGHYLGLGVLTPIACVVGLYLGRKQPLCSLAAITTILIWIATTFMPGEILSTLAAAVACYCGAGLFHEVDYPRYRAIALAAVTCVPLLFRFPNPCLIAVGLCTIILCLAEIARTQAIGEPRGGIMPGIAVALISLKLFPLEAMVYGLLVIALAAGLLAHYLPQRRGQVAVGALATLMVFSMTSTYFDQPGVLFGALAGAPIALAATAVHAYRPPVWLLYRGVLIALPFVALFYKCHSLWMNYAWMIPGGGVIRVVGRVILILLVPLGLGLAYLVELLDRRRLAIAGWAVMLFCLAEQGVTTSTFDALANRASIEGLARRIDRNRIAFYFHPIDHVPFHRPHLDAMWASLKRACRP